jgi:4-hydroxy-2-oxoheptanedioate aldolase
MRMNRIKQLWRDNKPAIGAFVSIPHSLAAEQMAHTGIDWLCVDMQHGCIDYSDAVTMLTAISTTAVTPIVRVPWNEPSMIMKVLDAGAYGVICPTMETAEDCARFVAACDYPPRGNRSWGPVRGLMYGGADYFEAYAGEILRIALIETAKGIENIEAIAATPGLDMLYLGPNDLGVSHGAKPSYTPNHPAVERAMDTVLEAAYRHGVAAGMHTASPAVARVAIGKGYRFVSLGYAAKIMTAAAAQALKDAFED